MKLAAIVMTMFALCSPAWAYSPPAMPPDDDTIAESAAAPAGAAGDQAAALTGTLAIRAIQGTPGGPAIAGTSVEVQLVHRGQLLQTITRTLDEHGVIIIEGIPVVPPIQPVVQIAHDGATYQRVGAIMDQDHAIQTVEVTCYELTDEPPDWTVSMRHVALERSDAGIQVLEILTLENPADHAWRGIADEAFASTGQRVTTRFDLTTTARNVQLGTGFHAWCCTTFRDASLINHLPLMPGTTKMSFSYEIPATDGDATVDIVAPAPTGTLMVMVPATMNVARAEGLDLMGEQNMNGTMVRAYMVGNLVHNQLASLTISGLGSGGGAGVTATAAPPRAGGHPVKLIAGIGGGLILLIGIGFVLARPAAKHQAHPVK